MKTSTRSKFIPADKRDLWTPQREGFKLVPFNVLRHASEHPPVTFLYTSTGTLSTTIGTPWYPTQDFVIETVQANVTGAPTGTLTWDVLIGGNSIFQNTAERPQIKSGDLVGRITIPSRQGLPAGSKLQAQGITVNAATGPLVLTFQLTAIS